MIILKEMANVDIRKNNIPRFQIDLFWRIYALYPQSVKRSFDKMGQTLKNWKVVSYQLSPKGICWRCRDIDLNRFWVFHKKSKLPK